MLSQGNDNPYVEMHEQEDSKNNAKINLIIRNEAFNKDKSE